MGGGGGGGVYNFFLDSRQRRDSAKNQQRKSEFVLGLSVCPLKRTLSFELWHCKLEAYYSVTRGEQVMSKWAPNGDDTC